MKDLKTTIGLEIHVQLKTESKMFCRCDNNAEDRAPNTVVCPVCLGLPGALPAANRQAIEWTIKTGLALDSKIPAVAKFDRKHYFYPDLPKGYQISQYDEPFCVGGYLEVGGRKVRFNRVHLEEDAGKLIHSGSKSLVDLNRAGTPLMEMVTEPDITSPKQAGDFLRRLQKLVRDEVKVSDADMEKGHMRCDANISITDGKRMSEIVEIKNINSFRFVEKALALEEDRLKAEYPDWPEKKGKVTRGYDSKKNITYVQRQKEEAADYRYFPEPDLPPVDTGKFDIKSLRGEIGDSLETRISDFESVGISVSEAKILLGDKIKLALFEGIKASLEDKDVALLARAVVNNYFPFQKSDPKKYPQYGKGIADLSEGKISKAQFSEIAGLIDAEPDKDYTEALKALGGGRIEDSKEIENAVERILSISQKEAAAYKNGKKELLGFFIGLVMKETKGRADPKTAAAMLKEKLEN